MTDTLNFSASQPVPLDQVPRWDFDTDVVVVGFGAAGASAAIEAARAGARVALFEVASGHGGTSALSGGEIYLGGGTPIQQAAGFEDTADDLYRYLVMAGGPNADAAKARLYADQSVEHYRWLTAQGVEYKVSYIAERCIEPSTDDCLIWSGSEEAWPFVDAARPAPRGHCPKFLGMGGGRYVMDVLAKRVEQANVQVRFDARALALVADVSRRVHGLVVRIDGEPRFARARRGVILCTGGFVMDREWSAPRCVDAALAVSDRHRRRRLGHRLGLSAGAAAINMNEGFTTVPWYPPGSLVKGIFVNAQGQRFINEDCYHGRVSHYILQQTGDRVWLLADRATYGVGELHALARMEIGAAAETWDEVESELTLPKGSLTATVALYNRYAAEGRDPLFHKVAKWLKPLDEPPFVALDCRIDHASIRRSLGGRRCRPAKCSMRSAMRSGLYAAGRTACGLPRWGEGYSSGCRSPMQRSSGARRAARVRPPEGHRGR